MIEYKPNNIEKKWRDKWDANGEHTIDLDSSKPKYYCLDMFPYPSGEGLHVGHWRGYVLSDVLARYKKLQGFNVLHPMGWDSFGLPAENAAIKKNIHPKINTKKNIDNMKRQLSEIGAMYDWSKEINTSTPEYYKWTQWIFLQMYKKGLAYKKEMPINWCKSCKTGLANEEVVNGLCERCGSDVVKKPMSQWMLKITDYAERLLKDLDDLNWPNKVKTMQKNWIGKSEGATIKFKVLSKNNESYSLDVFTTRPDTLFGATYVVLAPEHKLISKITTKEQKNSVTEYINKVSLMSEIDRTDFSKEKTGAFVGAYAINPINQKKVPVWISEYVLGHYGCGAIMAVPAHDDRDFDFAKKYDLPLIEVIKNDNTDNNISENAYTGQGKLINSGNFNNMTSEKAKIEILKLLESNNVGKKIVTYKLRDWVFARQRYWGEPIPIIYCPKCGELPVNESDLPVKLPHIDSYKPSGTGKSPLVNIKDFVNTTCPNCNGPAERETDTMPQWAGSSWYFLRYTSTKLKDLPFKKETTNKWLPVDYYVGGVEHAILHLLYARFFTKVLYDLDYINFDEPFKKLFNQGMICKYSEKTNKLEKMSKSKGNVVNPDSLVVKYGTDTLRLYELFIGDPELDCEWMDNGIEGIHRFLKKSWKWVLSNKNITNEYDDKIVLQKLNMLISQVTIRLDSLKFNTAVSAFMEFLKFIANENNNNLNFSKNTIEKYIILLSPFAPHICEELWETLGKKNSVFTESYPICEDKYLHSDESVIVIQINGKFKGKTTVNKGSDQNTVETQIYKTEQIKNFIKDKKIKKIVFVKDKLINIVI